MTSFKMTPLVSIWDEAMQLFTTLRGHGNGSPAHRFLLRREPQMTGPFTLAAGMVAALILATYVAALIGAIT